MRGGEDGGMGVSGMEWSAEMDFNINTHRKYDITQEL